MKTSIRREYPIRVKRFRLDGAGRALLPEKSEEIAAEILTWAGSNLRKGHFRMIALALKWLSRAMLALAVFSALTALFMYYTLNYGACAEGGETCTTNLATMYAAGLGIVGFQFQAMPRT